MKTCVGGIITPDLNMTLSQGGVYSVRVLNALLDTHLKSIRSSSEGGRLPLHVACLGKATEKSEYVNMSYSF